MPATDTGDGVGRLTRATITAGSDLDTLDYTYDPYGNMVSRDLSGLGNWPDGLEFLNRAYDHNQIDELHYRYDWNGNLVTARDVADNETHRMSFDPENRMTLVRPDGKGTIYQESRYDPNGDRWARSVSADGGCGLLTLRNAAGEVVTEYEAPSPTHGLVAKTDYVRAAGRLVAVESAADFIVTHDVRDFEGARRFSVRVIRPYELLDMMGTTP